MSPRPLSDTRIRILKRLASQDLERDGAESASEIADGMGTTLANAGAALITIAHEGLAKHIGWTM